MNRQDTIKDIAQYVCGACELDMTCKRDYGEFAYTCCDNALSPAVKIYEAGYRKEDDGRKESVKEFAEKAKEQAETFLIGYGDGQYDEYKYVSVEYIEELAKQFGVEVEE